jgi:hypothetical protein
MNEDQGRRTATPGAVASTRASKRGFVAVFEDITTHPETNRIYVAGQAATIAKRPNFPPPGVKRPKRPHPNVNQPNFRWPRAGLITLAVELRHPSNVSTTSGDNTEPISVRRSSISSFVTPWNTLFPSRKATLEGNRSCVKPEHPEKAHFPIVNTLDGICSCLKPEHSENAPHSIVVTLDGICSRVKPEHLENAHSPMVVTLDGISNCLKPEPSENALIVVTLDGICSCVKPVHSEKAHSSLV